MIAVNNPRFGILGAGNIGCHTGAHLIRAGIGTVLVGHETLMQKIQAIGLRITDFTGTDFRLEPEQVRYTTQTTALADRNILLVALKTIATAIR